MHAHNTHKHTYTYKHTESLTLSQLTTQTYNNIGLYRSATKEDMAKHRIQIAERLVKLCEKLSEEVKLCIHLRYNHYNISPIELYVLESVHMYY